MLTFELCPDKTNKIIGIQMLEISKLVELHVLEENFGVIFQHDEGMGVHM